MSTSARTIDQVFRVLRAYVPAQHPDLNETTAATWLHALERYPEQTVIEATTTWGAMHFPALGEFEQHVAATARRIAEEERRARADGELPTVTCPECGDGAGYLDDQGRQLPGYDIPVRPCSTCNFKAFWLWKNGHYGPDHTCQLCRDRRRRPDALDDAIAADMGAMVGRAPADAAF